MLCNYDILFNNQQSINLDIDLKTNSKSISSKEILMIGRFHYLKIEWIVCIMIY